MLKGSERKYLRGLAHGLDPVVQVGGKGYSDSLVRATEEALLAHELIKVKFLDFKDEKEEIAEKLAGATGAEIAGMVGHVVILYRPHPDVKKRRISLTAEEAGE